MKREKYEAIFNKVRELELALNGNGGGNPNHDPSNGQFTSGPGGKSKKSSGDKPKISKDAQDVFDEIDSATGGQYKKDFNAVLKEFSDLGLDLSKVTIETNLEKLPKAMRENIDSNTGGMVSSKKNLESIVYLDEDKQFDYGLGQKNKYVDGKPPKDQAWVTDNSPMGVLKHELGHMVAYTVFMGSRGRKETAGALKPGIVRMDMHSRFKKIFGNYDFNKLKLSRYGLSNHGEAVAEAFSNPDFSEDTRKIYDYYKKELSRLKTKNAKEPDSDWVILCDGYPKVEK